MKLKFLLNLFNKIFDKKKKVEEKQTCKCCISDIEDRFIEVSEDKKIIEEVEKKVVKPKKKKPVVKKPTIKKEKPLD